MINCSTYYTGWVYGLKQSPASQPTAPTELPTEQRCTVLGGEQLEHIYLACLSLLSNNSSSSTLQPAQVQNMTGPGRCSLALLAVLLGAAVASSVAQQTKPCGAAGQTCCCGGKLAGAVACQTQLHFAAAASCCPPKSVQTAQCTCV